MSIYVFIQCGVEVLKRTEGTEFHQKINLPFLEETHSKYKTKKEAYKAAVAIQAELRGEKYGWNKAKMLKYLDELMNKLEQ